jgi:hypothetical protein
MLIFLDTESTEGIDGELISIGLISEDGQHEFYAESADFNPDACSDFVKSEVLPHLGEWPDAKVDQQQLSERLRAWLTALPYDLITIACNRVMDLGLLEDALESDFPANIRTHYDMRLINKNPVFKEAVCIYHEDAGQPWHHALHDARASRLGWIAWNSSVKLGTAD